MSTASAFPPQAIICDRSQQDYKTRIWRVETKEMPLRLKKKNLRTNLNRSADRKSVVVTLVTELFGVMKVFDIALN